MAGPFDPASKLEIVFIRTYMSGYTAASIDALVKIHTPDGQIWPDDFSMSPLPPAAQKAANAGGQAVIGAGFQRYGISQLWVPT